MFVGEIFGFLFVRVLKIKYFMWYFGIIEDLLEIVNRF